MKWTEAKKNEAIRLWRASVPARQIAASLETSESSIRHMLRRHFDPFAAREREKWSRLKRSTLRELEAPPNPVWEDRNRRAALPDTVGSLLCGDPKPGSGQSALEQMRNG